MSLISYQLSEKDKQDIAAAMLLLRTTEKRGWNQCLKFLFGVDGRSFKVGNKEKVFIAKNDLYKYAVHSSQFPMFEPLPEHVYGAFIDRKTDGSFRHFSQYKYRYLGGRHHRIKDWYESNTDYVCEFLGMLEDKVVVMCSDEQYLNLLKEFNTWLDEEFYPNRGVE